ncbi:MAG: translation initiation factor [Muribaculaceae bacterium]|nr:translation initiation factor [Muribaculaceae bacterium]
MCAKPNNDWQSSLQAFLDSNPDLPQGEETPAPEPQNETKKHPRLDIIFEKKGRAGKTATIVSGFILDDDEVAAIASKMKSRLGTGGSARGGEILIQGDRRKDVLAFLTENGFKARII